jgi:integrase
MATAFIERRKTPNGTTRYLVRYRLGGRETKYLTAGSFKTVREARIRLLWVSGELAAMRIPDIRLVSEPAPVVTLKVVAEAWRASRIDVAEGTSATHRVNLSRIVRVLGSRAIDSIKPADVASFVRTLTEDGLARESIRKTLATLAMVFDFHGVQPNPARDRRTVRLPRDDREEVDPPAAPAVGIVYGLLPTAYRLPLLVLDATGMRVGELEALKWGDIDEPSGRWRVRASTSKTRRARWVPVDEDVFAAVAATVPREDRDLEAQVFGGFGADRLRTAITRACKAAAIPAFSPHDLRHRRATLWHLSGVPAAEAAAWLGHSAQEHLRTYAHATLTDRTELDYPGLLGDLEMVARRPASDRHSVRP